MPIIYTYPPIDPVVADLLVLSDASNGFNTASSTIADVLELSTGVLGGYLAVADIATRNAIVETRRKLGMACCTTDDNSIFTLTNNPAGDSTVNGDWTKVFPSTSGIVKLQDVLNNGTTTVPAFLAGLGYTTSDSTGLLPNDAIAFGTGDLGVTTGSLAIFDLPTFPIISFSSRAASVDPDHGKIQLQGQNDRGVSQIQVGDGRVKITGDEMGSPAVGDILVASSVDGSLEYQSINATITLDDTAISQLYTDPQVVIAAPGAGKFIQVHSVAAKFTYGTAQITGEVDLAVWEGVLGNAALFQKPNLLGSATSTFTQISPEDGTLVENSALSVSNGDGASADPTMNSSTASVKLYVNYSIITI